MKRWIGIFLLVLPLWGIEWHHNWETAVKAAKAQNRPMLVVLMRQDCPYCQRLAAETLSHAAIEKTVTEAFVPVYLDTNRHGAEIAKSGLKAQGVPASFVVDPKGNLQGRLMGYQPPMGYMGFLQQYR